MINNNYNVMINVMKDNFMKIQLEIIKQYINVLIVVNKINIKD